MNRWALSIGFWALCLALVSCQRETRSFNGVPAASANSSSPFQDNAWGISEGKRLFDQFNCSGCHAHGGGGMGPALMDEKWIYGSHPAKIFETIVEGRPNGMPSFRDKIPDQQVWQLVAYVQAMSGNSSIDSLPGRADHLRYATPENARPAREPVQTGAR